MHSAGSDRHHVALQGGLYVIHVMHVLLLLLHSRRLHVRNNNLSNTTATERHDLDLQSGLWVMHVLLLLLYLRRLHVKHDSCRAPNKKPAGFTRHTFEPCSPWGPLNIHRYWCLQGSLSK